MEQAILRAQKFRIEENHRSFLASITGDTPMIAQPLLFIRHMIAQTC